MARPLSILFDPAICNEIRRRRHGYRLRCLEPVGHDGAHRWTPELVPAESQTGPGPQRRADAPPWDLHPGAFTRRR